MLTSKTPASDAEQRPDYVTPIRANTGYVLAQQMTSLSKTKS